MPFGQATHVRNFTVIKPTCRAECKTIIVNHFAPRMVKTIDKICSFDQNECKKVTTKPLRKINYQFILRNEFNSMNTSGLLWLWASTLQVARSIHDSMNNPKI